MAEMLAIEVSSALMISAIRWMLACVSVITVNVTRTDGFEGEVEAVPKQMGRRGFAGEAASELFENVIDGD